MLIQLQLGEPQMPNRQNGASSVSVDAFLRPESMVTPGALGAIAMLVTNALAHNFAFISPAYLAILLSFIFGLTAIVKATSLVQKLIYYVINSLIIFSVAAGSNTIGDQAQKGPPLLSSAHAFTLANMPNTSLGTAASQVQFFQPWFGGGGGSAQSPTTISPDEAASGWSVIVGSDKDLSQIKKLRDDVNKRFPEKYSATISQNPSNGFYAVTIGGHNLSLSAAAEMQKQAVADGLAKDAYLKRSNLLQAVQ